MDALVYNTGELRLTAISPWDYRPGAGPPLSCVLPLTSTMPFCKLLVEVHAKHVAASSPAPFEISQWLFF